MPTAVDPVFGSIKVSSIIKIKRSDGRIHAAKVVQLSSEPRSVGVEWTEDGEVKGKEILLDLVFELNDELRPNSSSNSETGASTNQLVRPSTPNSVLSSALSASRLTLDIDALERKYDSRPPPTLPPQLFQILQQHPVFSQTNSTSLLPVSSKSATADAAHSKSDLTDPESECPISGRSKCYSTHQSNSSSAKPTTPVSPNQPVAPAVERKSSSQIPAIANNRGNRRILHLNAAQKSAAAAAPPDVVGKTIVEESPPAIGLHDSNINKHALDLKDLRICVAVRKRPLSKREIAKKDNDVITIPNKDHCLVHVPKSKVDLTKYLDNQIFKFDYTFDERTSTDLVYQYTAAPLIDTIFNGGNSTVFAYGQTGSGKTFTMGGDVSSTKADFSHGIYAQTARDIFHRLSLPQHRSSTEIFITFFEIYCGKVFDLLNNKKRLRVLEDQKGLVQVCDRTEKQVKSVQDVLNIIQYGMTIRTSGTTAANSNSSRSHAVLQIILKHPTTTSVHSNSSSSSSSRNNNRHNPVSVRRVAKEIGKISLIDLAGSERGKDTASGNRLQRMEGSEINKSLLALKECIRALGRGDGSHVPFRGSTLTKVLRDSFVGDRSKVCMIAMVSPTHSDVENTMNTLRYADRVKELRITNDNESNDDGEFRSDALSRASPDRDDMTRHSHSTRRDPSASSNDGASLSSLEDQVYGDDDDAQDEVSASYAAQIEHLQEHEDALFDACEEILSHKEPALTRQLRTIVQNAQNSVDYDQEKFVSDMRANLLQRQQILNELHSRLQAFSDCLQQEEQVAAAQRIKQQPDRHIL